MSPVTRCLFLHVLREWLALEACVRVWLAAACITRTRRSSCTHPAAKCGCNHALVGGAWHTAAGTYACGLTYVVYAWLLPCSGRPV